MDHHQHSSGHIGGIVLAAGRSERAGVFKPAFRHRGQPLLALAVTSLAPWCERLVVVGGHRHEEVAELLADIVATGALAGVPAELAVNRGFDAGMFSSVRVGAGAVDPAVRGFFVQPVDCPLVAPEVYRDLLGAFDRLDGRRAVVPTHQKRGGHPVLLPGTAREAILLAGPDVILRDIVRRCAPLRVPVASASVLMDLDTPADLADLARGDS